jgi:hypothetical protein
LKNAIIGFVIDASISHKIRSTASAVHQPIWSQVMSCKTTVITIASLLLLLVSVPLSAQETAEILLVWPPNPEPDVLRYIIYRSPDSITAHFSVIDSVNSSTTTYTDSDLSKGIPYYYRIKAKNSAGDTSPFSNNVSIFSIPQNASDAIKALCRITTITDVGQGDFDITWSNDVATIGFIQYGGSGGFDNMSAWDNAAYKTTHTVRISGLPVPGIYYVRAVAYDTYKNMFISAIDTIVATPNNPAPLSAPVLSAYPVPYHPGMGSFQINGLPPGGSATIYSETGLEVWHHDADGTGSISWNGTNKDRSRVMSGVYYLVIKDANGAVFGKRPIMIVNK